MASDHDQWPTDVVRARAILAGIISDIRDRDEDSEWLLLHDLTQAVWPQCSQTQ